MYAATITSRTVMIIPTHSTRVSAAIDSIRRHSSATVKIVKPTASQWLRAALVCQKYPR